MIAYSQVNELCLTYLPDLSASQLAGMLHGLVTNGYVPKEGLWHQELADFLNSGDPLPAEGLEGLESLLAFTQKDYQVDSFSIDLILPEDDYPLPQRVAAIGDWAQGFLTGYGLIKQQKELEGDAKEALQDLAQIAQIDSNAEEVEELEEAYMTICEHLKMSAQIIFAANQPEPTATANNSNKESIH
ncbi:UPF0149 family protein [Kangiella sp. TOML190]|uniref:UPF0149 family protein n=1 Tax=Kangiella sp. TOML190 TaxID=2931351 RepID=UPI00203F0991|nr:UPF0149 family protein [Kangiella sp. TOML190]